MEFDAFKLDRSKDGLVTITLNRPERRNALTFETYRQLCDFFESERRVDATRVVMLTGEGQGFCSGGDVHEIIGALRDAPMREVLEFAWMTGELIQNIREFDRPVIAAINGTCVGAGAVIALACDFRVLAEDASIGFIFTKVGLAGSDMGAAYLLPRVVGMAHATEILMLGEPVDAEKAMRIGLANETVPAADVVAAAKAIASKLLAGPPLGLRVTKRMLNNEWNMDLASGIESEAQAQALLMMGEDHTEYFRAFSEKRKPEFRGK
ncbi:MAG: enoyl-CoA hydratase family protein [Planctomycetota bacterium]|nr:enoyl-CoA hydratase [Planctomycetota bacterium]MEE2712254.1 enoyl-CoA hydratase family protein [Planctomycetota bacterium]